MVRNIIKGCILASILFGCENLAMDRKYPIYIFNDSEHSIGFCFAGDDDHKDIHADTGLPSTDRYLVRELESGQRYKRHSSIPWEQMFREHSFPNDTLSVFIFHSDTLKKYSWEEIRKGYRILKRYDLGLEDLKKSNWAIRYP